MQGNTKPEFLFQILILKTRSFIFMFLSLLGQTIECVFKLIYLLSPYLLSRYKCLSVGLEDMLSSLNILK